MNRSEEQAAQVPIYWEVGSFPPDYILDKPVGCGHCHLTSRMAYVDIDGFIFCSMRCLHWGRR